MITPQVITEIALSGLLFIVVWRVLGEKVYRPFFQLLEEREAKTSGADELVHEKRLEIRRQQKKLDDLSLHARLQGIALRDDFLAKAQAEGQELIHRSTATAEEELQRGREELEKARQRLYGDFDTESERVAEIVFERVLSTPDVLH